MSQKPACHRSPPRAPPRARQRSPQSVLIHTDLTLRYSSSAVPPHLPAPAAHLVAAEGNRRVEEQHRVDPHGAGLQLAAPAGGPCRRPGSRCRPPARRSCRSARAATSSRRIERQHAGHRAEDLLPGHPHVVPHVREHGGGDEIPRARSAVSRRLPPAVARAPSARPTSRYPVTRSSCSADTTGPIRVSRVQAVADLQAVRERRHAVDELVVDRPLDVDPGARAADLTRVREHPHGRAGNGAGQVGVGEHHVRGFAAQLERHPLEVAGRGPDDPLAGRRSIR